MDNGHIAQKDDNLQAPGEYPDFQATNSEETKSNIINFSERDPRKIGNNALKSDNEVDPENKDQESTPENELGKIIDFGTSTKKGKKETTKGVNAAIESFNKDKIPPEKLNEIIREGSEKYLENSFEDRKKAA